LRLKIIKKILDGNIKRRCNIPFKFLTNKLYFPNILEPTKNNPETCKLKLNSARNNESINPSKRNLIRGKLNQNSNNGEKFIDMNDNQSTSIKQNIEANNLQPGKKKPISSHKKCISNLIHF